MIENDTRAAEKYQKDREEAAAWTEVEKMRAKEMLPPQTSDGPMCTPPPPQVFIGPAPTPTPTPTPPPSLSSEDVAHGICEAADAVEPLMPDPATVGGPDVGDIIDQAYMWQQGVPPNPYFDTLIRVPIIVAKNFKDYASASINFVCQQVEREGPYYDLFPLDQKTQQVRLRWKKMDAKHKVIVTAYVVVALLIIGWLVLAK